MKKRIKAVRKEKRVHDVRFKRKTKEEYATTYKELTVNEDKFYEYLKCHIH